MSHFFCSFTCLLVLSMTAFGTNAKPIAVVHIGPPKTATTYFQSTLVKYNLQYLEGSGYNIWPDLDADQKKCRLVSHGRDKQMANFAHLMRGAVVCPEIWDTMHRFMNESLANNTNVVLSSEIFWSAVFGHADTFFDFFDGFHIHIVFTYRMGTSIFLSTFRETVKDGDYDQFFPEYLAEHSHGVMQVGRVYSILKKQFARKGGGDISIIDYYGVMAANVDISYAVLCGVMKILCDHKSLFSTTPPSSSSKSKNFDDKMIANAFREFARTRDCYYSATVHRKEVKKMNWNNGTVHTKKYDLTMLNAYSLVDDAEVREKYGSLLLFGNRTANELAREQHYISVDRYAILTDQKWVAIFEERLNLLRTRGECVSKMKKNI